jgi:16S rRNA (adenine1518-N6/adenine1519-N6)-dimethyltransferase
VPKVDSCFINLRFRGHPPVRVRDEAAFFRLVRTAFNQRRKTLRNSLAALAETERLDGFFEKNGMNRNIRPEDLSLEDFSRLGNYIGAC